MYCDKCGKELSGKEKFCPKCGKAVGGMQAEMLKNIKWENMKKEPWSVSTNTRAHKRGKKNAIVALCLIIILLVGSVGVFSFLKSLEQYKYLAVVENEEGLYGCINENDKEIIECKYDLITINEDHIIVWTEKEGTGETSEYDKGVLDTEGNVIIPIEYPEVSSFNVDGETVFALAEQVGIDEEGEPILNWGFADAQGNMITEFEYQYVTAASPSLSSSEEQGVILVSSHVENDTEDGYLYGAINNRGEEVIPLDSQYINPWQSIGNSGLLTVERKSGGEWKSGFINYRNETVLPFEYDEARNFMDNGLAAVKKGEKWGYIDREGNMIIPCRYDNAYDFAENGMARVESGDTTIYINEKGEKIIEGDWNFAYDFDENGFARVEGENGDGLIDEQGEEVFSCSYDSIYSGNDMYVAWDSYNCNVIDSGREERYDSLEDAVRGSYDYVGGMGDNGWLVAGRLREDSEKQNEYECDYIDENGNVRLNKKKKYTYAWPFERIKQSND